jgi:hypothetical protein
MLTIDSDYKHRIKGVLDAELAAGTSELTVVFSGISNFDELPASGIVTVYSTSGAGESIGYSSRSVSGNKVTLELDTAAVGSYAAGAVADVKQSPLCLAYLSTAKSDWANGHLVFDLAVDSARLRSLTEYSDTAKVNIDGIELLLYTVNSDNTVSLLKRFLWDSASLVNTLGDPGFPAPLPDAQKNYISEEIARQLAASGGGGTEGATNAIDVMVSADAEYFAEKDVETALQSIGSDIASLKEATSGGGGGAGGVSASQAIAYSLVFG